MRFTVKRRSVLYHFQHLLEEGRWQPMGSGEGFGRDPVRDAVSNLSDLSGGNLPAGLYRYLPVDRAPDARWRFLTVSKKGSVRISRR